MFGFFKKRELTQINVTIDPCLIRIFDENGEALLSEPIIVATDSVAQRIVAVGKEVDSTIRTRVYPKNVVVSEPFKTWIMQEATGEIRDFADMDHDSQMSPFSDEVLFHKCILHNDIETFVDQKAMNEMISFYLKKAFGKKKNSGYSARLVLAAGFSEKGRKCLKDAFESCGIKKIDFAEKPGEILVNSLDYIDENEYNVVIDVCENIMDMTLLKGKEIVFRKSIPKGTSDTVWDIQRHVRKEYMAVLSKKMAADIFNMIRCNEDSARDYIKVHCRDLVSGCPKDYQISTKEIEAVIDNDVSKLNEFIHMFFSEISEQNILPKEDIDEIKEKGIIYAGTLFPHGAMRIRSKWLQIN